jgi:hypothetical protein
MKCLYPIPEACRKELKQGAETGMGYHIVSVQLKDGRNFDQVVASEGCIIQVRGYHTIPFTPDDVAAVSVNHQRWNFRDGSDVRVKTRAAGA